MTTRIEENQLKGVLLIILFTILTLQSVMTQAQSFKGNQETYRGLFVNFGTRSAKISSDIAQIDQTNPMATGGLVGVVYGNSILRAKAGLLGYYSSTGTTAGTTRLYQSNLALNFYPMSMVSDRQWIIEPYLTGAVSYDQFKFFGFYVNQEPGVTNYSQEPPYLGKIKQVNATAGVGFEVKLMDRFDFIHLFSEVKYAGNLSSATTHDTFANTSLVNQMQIVVGISFGAHR